jgi:two-component system, cell cycle response regulator DivK
MAHTFDVSGFARLRDDLERLAAQAREQERGLSDLVGECERSLGPAVRESSTGEARAARQVVLAAVRELCIAARDQRLLTTSMLDTITGVSDGIGRGNGARRPRVLIVDDSSETRELVAYALDASGCATMLAGNGLEGVIAAHCALPDVVLMDITMPVLDGIDATRLLKASAATRDIKVIAHTAKSDVAEGASRRLFVDVLRKPAALDALVDCVQRHASA